MSTIEHPAAIRNMYRAEEEANKQQRHGRVRPGMPGQGANSRANFPPRPVKLVPPYFDYRDFSEVPDPNPSVPLTAPGRLPNFPVKMLAILSRPDLSHIISWMPHGRSWRVWKPREFEVKVIPAYFEHSKFSSFIRQANGWGFRRITKGPDRNSYYHELFLRGLPHLTKMMQRPHPSQKPALNPSTEPQFYKISQEHPLPECKNEKFVNDTNTVLDQCNLSKKGNDHQGQMVNRMPNTVVSRPNVQSSINMVPPQQSGYAPSTRPMGSFHPVSDQYDPIPIGQHQTQAVQQPIQHQTPAPQPQQQTPAEPALAAPTWSSFPDIEAFLRQCSQNAEALRAKMEAEGQIEKAPTQNERFAPAAQPSAAFEPVAVQEPVRVTAPSSIPSKDVWTTFTAEPVPSMTRSQPSADDLHSLGSIDILSAASDDLALDISNIDFCL